MLINKSLYKFCCRLCFHSLVMALQKHTWRNSFVFNFLSFTFQPSTDCDYTIVFSLVTHYPNSSDNIPAISGPFFLHSWIHIWSRVTLRTDLCNFYSERFSIPHVFIVDTTFSRFLLTIFIIYDLFHIVRKTMEDYKRHLEFQGPY